MRWSADGAREWWNERGVNLLDGSAPSYDLYEMVYGKGMAVGALEPPFYAGAERRT
jgi:alpha-methylacyl-CoA racemase